MLQSNNTTQYAFSVLDFFTQAIRINAVKLKIQDPNCRFRLEQTVGTFQEVIEACQIQEQGLEKPETHWVELSEYVKVHPKPDDGEIVYECVRGVKTPGVNVLTGKKGWWKRIDNSYNQLAKKTDLSGDASLLDQTGAAIERIAKAAEKMMFKKHTHARAGRLHEPSSASTSKPVPCVDATSNMEVDSTKSVADPEAVGSDDEDDDMGMVGMLDFFKKRFDCGGGGKSAKGEPKAKVAKAKGEPKAKGKAKAKSTTNNTKTIGTAGRNKRKAACDLEDWFLFQTNSTQLFNLVFE